MTRGVAVRDAGPGSGKTFAVAVWAVLPLAFSPTLVDLAGHVAENPWFLYAVVVFPLLFLRCALQDEAQPARDGWLWILAGLAIELAAIFLGAVRVGRMGLALAVTGVCRLLGQASWRSLLLLWLAVPLPASLVRIASPHVQVAVLEGAIPVFGALGVRLGRDGYSAVFDGGRLVLTPFDNGVTLAVLLAGLVWYDGVIAARPLPGVLLRMLVFAAAALPLQAIATGIAVAIAAGGFSGPAREFLSFAPWIATALVGVAVAESRR